MFDNAQEQTTSHIKSPDVDLQVTHSDNLYKGFQECPNDQESFQFTSDLHRWSVQYLKDLDRALLNSTIDLVSTLGTSAPMRLGGSAVDVKSPRSAGPHLGPLGNKETQ